MPTFAQIVEAEKAAADKAAAKRARAYDRAQAQVQTHGRNAKRVWTQRNARAEAAKRACR